MLFADTSYLVALARPNDENHMRAVEIAKNLKERLATTDHVLSEFVTLLSYKNGNDIAYSSGKKIAESEIVLLSVLKEDIPAALEYIRKYPRLSMCDAFTAITMSKTGMKKVISFDFDFDRLGIERIF